MEGRGHAVGVGRFINDWAFSPRLAYGALTLAGAAAVVYIYLFDPRVSGYYPICPFFGLTGWHCPGCGSLRALHVLIHGNGFTALGYNAFAVMSLPFVLYSYLSGGMRAFGMKPLPTFFIHHRLIWGILTGIVAFCILRNTPIEPFNFLAP